MRVDGLDVDFEFEAVSGRLHRGLFIDGRTTESIDQRDGHRLLVDLESQSVLVVTKRGAQQLVPLGSFAGLVVKEAPSAIVPPSPAPPASPPPAELDEVVDLTAGGKTSVSLEEFVAQAEEEPPFETQKKTAKKPPLKRRR